LYEGQHCFSRGYSCESQLFIICRDIAYSLDEGARTDTIIIGFSKAFNLVRHDRLLTKIAAIGVDLRVKEFLFGHSQRGRLDGQPSEEVRVNSGVLQGSVLGPPIFLAYVNDIWRILESNKRPCAGDCIIYRKIMDSSVSDKLQTHLNKSGDWAVENELKVNPSKSKTVSFTEASLKKRIRYYFEDQLIPEASSFKYLGIIIRSDQNGADHVN